MFEQTIDKEKEKNRTRIFIVSSGIFVMALAAAGLLYNAFSAHKETPQQPGLAGAQRAGTTDFDAYAKDIAITNQEFYYSENVIGGRQIIARGRVQNLGARFIKGLEVRAVAYDFEGKALRERIAAPIPRVVSDPLIPNGTLPITVVIDSAPEEYLVKEIRLELKGLILQ